MKLHKLTKAWFPLEGDDDCAEFEIKHLRAGEISGIVNKTHIQKFEFKSDGSDEVETIPVIQVDSQKEKELTIIEAVTNWKNIYDADGLPLQCNKENKLRLCKELGEEEFTMFYNFVQASRETLALRLSKREEDLSKN